MNYTFQKHKVLVTFFKQKPPCKTLKNYKEQKNMDR